ncbi:porin [Halotalea alkalilenta]|uniref:Porin domain-containing protein n=1 Tax=Halotalea alkalilenta TaxID=376489 RepID=A0A172YDT5_9GAMM|nr:porin [Halotalea alkalilenta]ANF57430.1 hypothetical protein A5892_08100 [Halotalea alkalilenta]
MKINQGVLAVTAAGALLYAASASAEITLLERDNGSPVLNNLKLQVGGSIRSQYRNKMGGSDDGSYMHRGYDGGTRLRITAEYFLSDDLRLLGYYEPGVDIFNTLDWNRHYDHDRDNTTRRQLYVGVASNTYGTLTYGKQNSVFYSVIGEKTDVWDNDMHGQGPGNGVNGDYDGSYRARDLIKYVKDIGPVKLTLGWTLPTNDYYLGGDEANLLRYKRKSGGAIGADYRVTPDLTLSAAYSYTRAEIRQGSGDPTGYDQQMSGTAVQWKPDNWTLSAMVGVYEDFVPLHDNRVPTDYFEGTAQGWEYFAGYKFPLDMPLLKSTQPYVAGDGMRWDNYQTNHQYVGLATQLAYGFRVDLERTFTNTSDNQPDENWVRLRYDF